MKWDVSATFGFEINHPGAQRHPSSGGELGRVRQDGERCENCRKCSAGEIVGLVCTKLGLAHVTTFVDRNGWCQKYERKVE